MSPRAMLPDIPTCGWKLKRRALDEIAVRQHAADEKRKVEAEGREQVAVAPESLVLQ